MITKDALYAVLEDEIAISTSEQALFEAITFRNLRGPVDANQKVVRLECMTGRHCMTTEDARKELIVESTIQTFVLPASNDLADLEAAKDMSFAMSRQIFVRIANDPNLNGAVCDAYFDEFETGDANIGATIYGTTYLDGLINNAS